MKKLFTLYIIALLTLNCGNNNREDNIYITKNDTCSTINKKYLFDIDITDMIVEKKKIHHGQTIWGILKNCDLSASLAKQISDTLINRYKIETLQDNKLYFLIKTKDNNIKYIVYQKNTTELIIFNLKNNTSNLWAYPIKHIEQKVGIYIENNLWNAVRNAGVNTELVVELENRFGKSINFSDIKEGDELKVVFDEIRICDTIFGGISKIKTAWFYNCGKEIYAFPMQCTNQSIEYWFDADGKRLFGQNQTTSCLPHSIPEKLTSNFKTLRDSCIMILNQIGIKDY